MGTTTEFRHVARRAGAVLATGVLLAAGPAAGLAAAADGDSTGGAGGGVRIADGECTFPSKPIAGTPWALQRLILPELRAQSTGKDVKVAVIDTGVDVLNPQLSSAVSLADGLDVLEPAGNGTKDEVGHGTKVAGIIAARPATGTGFVGIAPEAQIIAIRQNDGKGGGNVGGLNTALRHAISKGAKVINISQDTVAEQDPAILREAINLALAADIVVVAAAGNDGATGQAKPTYPAAYPGVLAVAASDRNNERAAFSQPGIFVGIAAPGVDIISTVPAGGQCLDAGTSFAAPYVAGVAALIRSKHPDWKARQVIAQIEQTAQRTDRGRNDFIGWGVVDPLAALTKDTAGPPDAPVADAGLTVRGDGVDPVPLSVGESPEERHTRYATYVAGSALLIAVLVIGGAIVLRDNRRRHPRRPGSARVDAGVVAGPGPGPVDNRGTESQQARRDRENGELQNV